MNIVTCHRRLIEDVKRKDPASSDQAMMAIIDAMEHYKFREFHFNKGWQQVFLPANSDRLVAPISPINVPVTRPGIPHGLIRPHVIQVTGLVTSGDILTGELHTYEQITTDPLIEVSAQEIWEMLGGQHQLTSSTPGIPRYYAWIDGPIRQIRVAPQPYADMVADVYGSEDAHRPRYSWTANAWKFEGLKVASNLSAAFWVWAPLDETFTNLWLENAELLIRSWARRYLYANYFGDQKMAQFCNGQVLEQEEQHMLNKVAGHGGNISIVPSSL